MNHPHGSMIDIRTAISDPRLISATNRIDDRTVEPDQAKDGDDALRDPQDRNETGSTQEPEVKGVRDPDRMIHIHDLIDAPDPGRGAPPRHVGRVNVAALMTASGSRCSRMPAHGGRTAISPEYGHRRIDANLEESQRGGKRFHGSRWGESEESRVRSRSAYERPSFMSQASRTHDPPGPERPRPKLGLPVRWGACQAEGSRLQEV